MGQSNGGFVYYIRRFVYKSLLFTCKWVGRHGSVRVRVSVRPVSDSPTVFSLARRQISLAFLAERAEREKQT